ncbi:CPBP family intramembrane glutamic endopeptidase [Salegentibacter chungangensis]|uniref:CPBP family intramembrane glutamic endopeptidase n=1 Tax=Salegentibacter chungangensis TaxID=1335724 RepID=A0ABW3NUL0_9FLAO
MPETDLLFKLKNLFRNYGMLLACYFIFFLFLGFLNAIFPEFDFDKYEQSGLFKLMDENPLKFALMAVVFAPIVEEGVFRSLIRPSHNELIFFLCCLLALSGMYILPTQGHWLLKFAVILLGSVIIFIFLKSFLPEELIAKLRHFLYRHTTTVWLLTSFLFGLVHIGNYVEAFEINLLLILLIFPRILAGYFFGKLKLENHSLLWPILMHALNNGIIMLFMLPRFL